MADRVVIASACRTAVGKMGGALSTTPAAELGAIVIKEAVKRAGIKPEDVDQVFMGCVIQAAQGQNVARQCSLKAGLPVETPAVTLNVVCGSGLYAVNLAADLIKAGEADIVVAGGTENMSMAPYALTKARFGYRMNNGTVVDCMVNDALWQTIVFDTDEGPRGRQTAADIAKLRAINPDGVTTAGNASGINDGAAAIVVMSESKAKELGVTPMAVWTAGALGGVDPSIMGVGPVAATRKVLKKTGLTIDDFDLYEANEAFAAQSVAVGKDLGFDMNKLNVNGGAIAIGHPVGASGARILTTLLYAMKDRDAKRGLATLCIGGGMGCATVVEKYEA